MPKRSRKNNVLEAPQTDGSGSAPEITHDAIAHRAYDIYIGRGGVHGHDFDDWLQAERELLEKP